MYMHVFIKVYCLYKGEVTPRFSEDIPGTV